MDHVTHIDLPEEDYIRETIQELTVVISNEWLQEGELALNPIQFDSPSSSFRCCLYDQDVDALYNPSVGANFMLDEFVLAFLGDRILTHTERKLRRPSGSLVNSYGVLRNVSF